MNIPEGFVLVPVEPTAKMLDAAVDDGQGAKNLRSKMARDSYSLMIAAAPPVELNAYDEAKERELFEGSFSSFPEGIWFSKHKGLYLSVNGRIYEQGQANDINNQFAGWKACAQSRDGSVSDE